MVGKAKCNDFLAAPPSFGEPVVTTSESLDVELGYATLGGMSSKIDRVNDKPLMFRSTDVSNLKASFIDEMRRLSKLQHPCIVTVMGVVNCRNIEPMLVMGKLLARCASTIALTM